jgi:hypothetical protein
MRENIIMIVSLDLEVLRSLPNEKTLLKIE